MLAWLFVEIDVAAGDFFDDHVADDACFGVFEGGDEADGFEGDGLLDGAEGAFVLLFGADGVRWDVDVHLLIM